MADQSKRVEFRSGNREGFILLPPEGKLVVRDRSTDVDGVTITKDAILGPDGTPLGTDEALNPLSPDFGAKGDGTTDDTAALQSWIDACASQGRRGVAPKRTYLISGRLEVASGVDLDFSDATIKVADDADESVTALAILGESNISIANLHIDCNSPNRDLSGQQPQAPRETGAGNGISIRDASGTLAENITIENVHVKDAVLYGISLRGCKNVLVRGCTADGFGDDGIECGSANGGSYYPANNVSIVNCIGRNGTGAVSANSNGFEVDDGAHHVTIVGCLAEENARGGIEVHPHPSTHAPHDITITGNVCRNNTYNGIRVTDEATAERMHNIVVANNVVSTDGTEDASFVAIRVTESDQVTVANNMCDGLLINAAGKGEGLSIVGNTCLRIVVDATTGDWTGVLIEGNQIQDSTNHGIVVLSTTTNALYQVAIRGNIINGTTLAGIRVEDTDGEPVLIEGNHIEGHTVEGIVVAETAMAHIANNVIKGTTATTVNTEAISYRNDKASIVGNRIFGGRSGIRVDGDDAVITGNRIEAPGHECILLNGGERAAITGNTLVGGERGINGVSGANHAVISGNVITGGSAVTGSAIQQQAGADYWTVTGNDWDGESVSFAGANNRVSDDNMGLGPPSVASASSITLPPGRLVDVTGTGTITNIAGSYAGRVVTLKFGGPITVQEDGSNLQLAGNFSATANDTLTIVWDGSKWIELSRSDNTT